MIPFEGLQSASCDYSADSLSALHGDFVAGSPPVEAAVQQIAELAGGLAHELRNPLSTLMMNLKLIVEDLRDASVDFDNARRRALLKLDVVYDAASRLQQLFDDFLNVVGPCKPVLANVDLAAFVNRLVRFFFPMAQAANVELVVSIAPDGSEAFADEKLLSQAVLNLLINAKDALPHGGKIVVQTRRTVGCLHLDVIDNGAGFEESTHARIMRPFFSTKKNGAGLGLPITRRIVEAHGGKLSFVSALGKGTTFTISLPSDRASSIAAVQSS